jgi:hypothetical protein
MLNGTSAFQKLLACNCPEAWGSFLPACWFSTTSPILGSCGTGIREPLRRISCTKHTRWVAKRPPQRKCILKASLSLGCDGISCVLLSSLNRYLETSLLNGRLLDSMYQKADPSASFHTYHLMSLTTYWCYKSHWIASAEPEAKLLQVVPNELLDPIADQISLPVISMNNCALLDYNPPLGPRLCRTGNTQPTAGLGHPWPGLAGSGTVVAGPRGENPRGFWAAYPCIAGCPGGRRCIRGTGQVQCDETSSTICSGCAFAKSAPALHLRQCH